MKVIANGVIPGSFVGVPPAYNLLDIEMTGINFANCKQMLFDYLRPNYVGAGTSGSQGDHTLYISNLPSIWAETGFSPTSQAAMMSDVGFCFGVSSFTGEYGKISFSDGKAVNGYSNFNAPTDGGVYLNMSPATLDASASYTSEIYDIGIYVQVNFTGRGDLGIFFTKTSEVYFFHSAPFDGGFGPIAKGLRNVIVSTYCNPNKIHLLRSKISTVSGSIEDAAGNVAPNCKVFMYRRSDGKLLGSTISNSEGKYTMNTHALTGDSVFMVCLDDDNAPDFEGIVYDRVTV